MHHYSINSPRRQSSSSDYNAIVARVRGWMSGGNYQVKWFNIPATDLAGLAIFGVLLLLFFVLLKELLGK